MFVTGSDQDGISHKMKTIFCEDEIGGLKEARKQSLIASPLWYYNY